MPSFSMNPEHADRWTVADECVARKIERAYERFLTVQGSTPAAAALLTIAWQQDRSQLTTSGADESEYQPGVRSCHGR